MSLPGTSSCPPACRGRSPLLAVADAERSYRVYCMV
jgi:hypothetical protein